MFPFFWLIYVSFSWSFCLSLTEMSASASASSSVSPGASSALASTRPRHVKSMSASGHPSKSPLPPIEDNAELKG